MKDRVERDGEGEVKREEASMDGWEFPACWNAWSLLWLMFIVDVDVDDDDDNDVVFFSCPLSEA